MPSRVRFKAITLRRILCAVAAALCLAAIAFAVKTYRYHFIPRRFGIVEAGGIYRGGRQTPSILRRIVGEYDIRTIVNLDDRIMDDTIAKSPEKDIYRTERAFAFENGIHYHGFMWKGSGAGPFAEYDAAARLLADATRPIFVHCAAGDRRTNAALAAYWIRCKGLTFEQALERLRRDWGMAPDRRPEFVAYLRRYYEYTLRNPWREEARLQPGSRPRTNAAATAGNTIRKEVHD